MAVKLTLGILKHEDVNNILEGDNKIRIKWIIFHPEIHHFLDSGYI